MELDVVGQYWRGVAQRLQAEVDVMNQLIAHNLTKGEANEAALSRVVENLIPARFGVGSGLLIDSLGHYSRQMDLIIYDRADEPSILAQAGQVLFPVEIVRLCVEVKTTTDSAAITDARKKKASVNALHLLSGVHPPVALFGFGSSAGVELLASGLNEQATPDGPRPDAATVLNKAFIARPNGENAWVAGVTALQTAGDGGVIVGSAQEALNTDTGPTAIRGGTVYPVVQMPGARWLLGEPSRALLLFCEWMLSALASDPARPLALSAYLTEAARDLQVI